MRRLIVCARCKRDRRYHARGLCSPCHRAAYRAGRLDDYPLRRQESIPSSDLIAEADYLVSVGERNRTAIARRLGQNLLAFEQALYRARRAGNQVATRIWQLTAEQRT